jgi:hypothetical protein
MKIDLSSETALVVQAAADAFEAALKATIRAKLLEAIQPALEAIVREVAGQVHTQVVHYRQHGEPKDVLEQRVVLRDLRQEAQHA